MRDLTESERKVIDGLKRLAKRWPKSLKLYSASGSLEVVVNYPDREIRPEDVVTTIYGIPNDGGDW